MSAAFNTAVLGQDLRVGTIPSIPICPEFPYLSNQIESWDGGLVKLNGPYPNIKLGFISPNGNNFLLSGENVNAFYADGYGDLLGGLWFDTEYNKWGACPNPLTQNGKSYLSMLYINKETGDCFYSSMTMILFLAPLISIGYFSGSKYARAVYGGFSRNFVYAGIDQIIANLFPSATGSQFYLPMEISVPYGVSDMDFSGALVGNSPPASTACPFAGAATYYDYGTAMCYRPGPGQPLFIIPPHGNANLYFLTSSGVVDSGRWHQVSVDSTTLYLGRLWNGFVFSGVFPAYNGLVYTDDFLIFRPLIDITGNLNFSNNTFYGLTGTTTNSVNYFMSGHGYSYLANYVKGGTPFTQAAYKIYPAFNFNPLIPDKFFVPNICGCNNSAPILKNGVIQHA